jgi:hypothetical protein
LGRDGGTSGGSLSISRSGGFAGRLTGITAGRSKRLTIAGGIVRVAVTLAGGGAEHGS